MTKGKITSQLTLTGFTRRAAIALLCVKPSSYLKRYIYKKLQATWFKKIKDCWVTLG